MSFILVFKIGDEIFIQLNQFISSLETWVFDKLQQLDCQLMPKFLVIETFQFSPLYSQFWITAGLFGC